MLLKQIKNQDYIQSDVFRKNQSHKEKACDKYPFLQKEELFSYHPLPQPTKRITVKPVHDPKIGQDLSMAQKRQKHTINLHYES